MAVMPGTELCVVLDGWVRPASPASASSPVTWVEYCYKIYAATPPWERSRWVMDPSAYRAIQAEVALSSGYRWVPDDQDCVAMLFGIPIEIRVGGRLPHLE
jgi:hypothetical protein